MLPKVQQMQLSSGGWVAAMYPHVREDYADQDAQQDADHIPSVKIGKSVLTQRITERTALGRAHLHIKHVAYRGHPSCFEPNAPKWLNRWVKATVVGIPNAQPEDFL